MEGTDDVRSQEEVEPEAESYMSCGESAGKITPIDRGSVHRICSGQVVLTLATAVKELVENSIDAGATIVEVRLKDSGSSVIEVIDNGAGVEEANFEGLTLKHHTSKLQDFSDLIKVETFGFRGEALSSLCALSQLSVTSRHRNASVGHKLEFDYHGKLVNKVPCARQVGSSVTLQNLFSTLPVRHKEFQRNLKKEFSRMVQVLNAYCVISTNVRLTCTNQQGTGKRNIVVSTNGNATMRENISNIFGPKQVQSLLEFSQIKPTDNVCEELGLKIPEKFHIMYKVTGFVSSCAHGSGRSSSDRQFYFINSRPCDPTKVSKLVNEVYHTYNRHQYPFTALDIKLDKEHVDVNVTPDKRQIFVQEEKLLLAIIKSSLIKIFEPIHSVYQVNHGFGKPEVTLSAMFGKTEPRGSVSMTPSEDCMVSSSKNAKADTGKCSVVSTLAKLKRSFTSAFSKEDGSDNGIVINSAQSPGKQPSKQRRLDNFIHLPTKESTEFDSTENCSQNTIYTCRQNAELSSPDVESGFCTSQECVTLDSESYSSEQSDTADKVIYVPAVISDIKAPESYNKGDKNVTLHSIENSDDSFDNRHSVVDESTVLPLVNRHQMPSGTSNHLSSWSDQAVSPSVPVFSHDGRRKGERRRENISNKDTLPLPTEEERTGEKHEMLVQSRCEDSVIGGTTDAEQSCSEQEHRTGKDSEVESRQTKLTFMEFDRQECTRKKETKVTFSLGMLKNRLKTKNDSKKTGDNFYRNFRATISPTDNQSAEDELQREIKKEMFSEMEILGQFNLGFIIAKLKEDLFIIDQHATDEKYNFEMLQKNTVIQSQRLIHAQCLELTASNEIILLDNLEIFRKNGFDFQIDQEAAPTQRVKLISTPMSKNWTFGKEDIEEMIFMLSESPGIACRPTRVRQMFASRSCRKAIMIGTALDKPHMKTLVSHMGEIDQPWNCPHGRPTMRHLINLKMVNR